MSNKKTWQSQNTRWTRKRGATEAGLGEGAHGGTTNIAEEDDGLQATPMERDSMSRLKALCLVLVISDNA
jgi:hypothetical protein